MWDLAVDRHASFVHNTFDGAMAVRGICLIASGVNHVPPQRFQLHYYTCTCDAADGEDQAKARNSYQAAPVVLLGPPRFGRHDGNGVPNDDDDADGDGVCWAINLVSK